MSMEEVIHDWNEDDQDALADWKSGLEFYDESLRDGIQSPSATDPSIEDKEKILALQDRCGIQHTDIGLPGAGPRAVADVTHLAKFARDQRLRINLTCAARTHPNDIKPIIAISEQVGVPIEVMAFLGSSPIRQFAEGWEVERMVQLARDAVQLAVSAGLPCTFVTEDTVRSTPETLSKLFEVVLGEGAQGLCICDTVGHATPSGARNIVQWVRNKVVELGHPETVIDWHGHNDRGLGLINAIAAAQAGAKRIHGTILGVGERVGNTQIDLLLVNMKLLGVDCEGDLSALREYAELGAQATSTPLPFNYPVFGTDAFRTGTGVHAAAIIKAIKKGDNDLADQVYSGVPAGLFGLHQVIEVGHMGGRSNVEYWLRYRGIEASDELISAIFETAKTSNRVLDDDEVLAIVRAHEGLAKTGDKEVISLA
ncbi:MAG: 2-isopropylmalate synthase [Rickettsiales bacterium]|nr:2-isopropylmalate synthase [Rickettsiales bacterium]|tara:strand:+ start:6415 stop:7692 length:1278 start_codon:yes stop_codon:yes gene_type:complete